MNKAVLAVLAALVFLGAGAWYVSSYVSQKPLSADEDAEVRMFVMDFGSKLKMVSLLAPQDELKAAIELYYGPYLSAQLAADLASAGPDGVGRETSNPYPERIEIGEVRKTTPKTYVVQGNLIEIATAASSTEVTGISDITLALERRDGKLRIVKIEKGSYQAIGTTTAEQ